MALEEISFYNTTDEIATPGTEEGHGADAETVTAVR